MRVGVAGALGRLGRVASAAIDAADDLHLAAGFGRSGAGERLAERLGFGGDARLFDDLGRLLRSRGWTSWSTARSIR